MERPAGKPRRPNEATFDHVLPRSLGGTNVKDNLVIACLVCNGRRGNQRWDVYLQIVSSALSREEEKLW
jgi:5-methylcytosine-specific restriction endonuclease McrA